MNTLLVVVLVVLSVRLILVYPASYVLPALSASGLYAGGGIT